MVYISHSNCGCAVSKKVFSMMVILYNEIRAFTYELRCNSLRLVINIGHLKCKGSKSSSRCKFDLISTYEVLGINPVRLVINIGH